MVTIYSSNGEKRFETEINVGSKRVKNLGSEDYALLKFSVARPVAFSIGDYADIPGEGRMLITTAPQPKYNTTTGGYDYELELCPEWMLFSNKILTLNPGANAEVEFKLTDTIDNHLRMVMKCISATGLKWHGDDGMPNDYTFDISPDTDIVADDSRFISYSSMSIMSGLQEIASVFECECWIENGVIHFGKNEHGDIVTFERDSNISNITPSGRDGSRPTRLYAFGGTENLPSYYRKKMEFKATRVEHNDNNVLVYDDSHPLRLDMFPKSMLVPDPFSSINFSELGAHYDSGEVKNFGVGTNFAVNKTAKCNNVRHGTYTMLLSQWKPKITIGGTPTLYYYAKVTCILTVSYLDIDGETLTRSCESSISYFPRSGEWPLAFSDMDISLPCDSDVTVNVYIEWEKTNPNMTGCVIIDTPYNITATALSSYYSAEGITIVKSDGSEVKNVAFNSSHNPDVGLIPLELPSSAAFSVGDSFALPDIVRLKIPASWFTPLDSEAVVDAVASNRLRLPSGIPYIDANSSVNDVNAIEHVEIFDTVFPKQENKVSNVWSYEKSIQNDDGSTTSEWYFCIAEPGIGFSSDCIIPGTELRIKFTSGSLNGMTFQVEWLPYGKSETEYQPCFEIVVNDDFGRRLPNTIMKPKAGDEFLLLGWADDKVYDTLVDEAEQELKTKAEEWMESNLVDGETFDCPMLADKAKEWMPEIGQRIKLAEPSLFPSGSYVSRVIGLEYPLDIPFDSPVVKVGNKIPQKRLDGIEGQIKSLGKVDDYTIPERAVDTESASVVECDLTNQSDMVVFDDFGTIVGGLPSTSVRVWIDGTISRNFTLSLKDEYPGLGISIDGDTVRISSADLSMADRCELAIVASINSGGNIVEKTLVFTILKRRGDTRYQLMPSHTSIHVSGSGSMYPNPKYLTCDILAIGNGTTETLSTDKASEIGLYVQWRAAEGDNVQDEWHSTAPEYKDTYTTYQCRLMQGSECIDIESIPIVNDGKDGKPGEPGTPGEPGKSGQSSLTSFVFAVADEQPATPAGGSYASPVPSGWSDGIPSNPDNKAVWMSRRIFTSDGLSPQEEEWTEPVIMASTPQMQIRYSSASAKPNDPSANASAWGETADENTVWMAVRHRLNSNKALVWSAWEISRIKGEKGEKGKDGTSVTVDSTSVTYSTQHTATQPADGTFTLTSVPTSLTSGDYLWARSIVTFTDGKSTKTYSLSRIGVNGDPGKDGTSISIASTSVTYAVTTSGTQPADSSFTHTSVPTLSLGAYLWTKTVVTYSDGKNTKTYSVSRIGTDGQDGQGVPGADGKTYYTHFAYSTSSNGAANFNTSPFEGATYIGICTDENVGDPTSYTAYKWSRYRGEDGLTPIFDKDKDNWEMVRNPNSAQMEATRVGLKDIQSKSATALSTAEGANKIAGDAATNAGEAKNAATNATDIANSALTTAQGKADATWKIVKNSDGTISLAKTGTSATPIWSHQSLSDYVKTSTLESNVNTLQSAINGKVSMKQVEDKGYTTIDEVEEQGYIRINNQTNLSDIYLSLVDGNNGYHLQACGKRTVNSQPQCFIMDTVTKSQLDSAISNALSAFSPSVSVVNSKPTLSWGATSTIGTVGGTALQVTMPANPVANSSVMGAHTVRNLPGFAKPADDPKTYFISDVSTDSYGHVTKLSRDGIDLTQYATKSGLSTTVNNAVLAALPSKWDWADISNAPDMSQYVTTNTAQTISGAKTFSSANNAVPVILNSTASETLIRICSNGVSKSCFGWINNTNYGAYMYNYACNKYLGIKDNGTPHFDGNTLWHTGNLNPLQAQPGLQNVNMNDVAALGNTFGMVYLTDTNTTINPPGKSSGSSWYHFINLSYNTESTNMWQTQFAVRAGTSEFYFRSRSGGSISDGTAWRTPWTQIATCNWVQNQGYITASSLNYLNIMDVRGVERNPDYFKQKGMTTWLNATGTPSANWYSGIQMKGWSDNYTSWQICANSTTSRSDNDHLYFRTGINSTWGEWKTIAFTSDKVANAGHADKATQLDHSVTLWGQSFNGTGNVSGDISNAAGGIYLHCTNEINCFNGALYLNHRGGGYGSLGSTGNILALCHGGNFGIGTASPGYKLDVNGSAYIRGDLWISYNNTSTTVQTQLTNLKNLISDSEDNTMDWAADNFLDNIAGTDKVQYISPGSTVSMRLMTVQNTGDYAGNNTPLEIGMQSFRSWARQNAFIRVASSDFGKSWATFTFGSSGQFSCSNAFIANLYMSKNSNQPYLYASQGQMYIQNPSSYIDEDSHLYGFTYHAPSDLRLKNIIRDLTLDVSQIAAMPSVEFAWKKNGKRAVGTIAQPWQGLLPLVVSSDNDGMLSMQYGEAALISVISVARKTCDHERRISVLEAENKELKEKIKELENITNNQNKQL